MAAFVNFLSFAPYKLVFTSGVSLSIFLFLIFFFRNIYPKKSIPYLILLIGFSLLPIISILRQGSYESGDLTLHTSRLIAFYKNLQEGILIPRWAGDLNATYGYALFNFYYPLPYYISSFFHFLGFNFLVSMKLLLIFSYIFSGIFMFLWLKKHVSEKYAFLGAIFYLFAPYHLIDLHFRVAIGEVLLMAVLPLCFLSFDLTFNKGKNIYVFLLGLTTSFLILSHAGVSLLGFTLLVSYCILHINIRSIMFYKSILGIFLGLLFSAYYSVPAIVESKYVHAFIGNFTMSFPKFTELIVSSWRYGFLFQGPHGELSFTLGYSHIIIIIISLFTLLKNSKKRKYIYFFLFSSLTLIFLLTPLSFNLWKHIPLIKNMLLTYRVLAIFIFTSSALAAFVLERLNRSILFYILLVVAIGSTILNWGNRKNTPEITDLAIINNLPYVTFQGEGGWNALSTYNSTDNLWQSIIPTYNIEALEGHIGLIKEDRSIQRHYYVINSENKSLVKENTYYFPGWDLKVDGISQQIIPSNKKYPGVITFTIEKGIHTIELTFKDTPIRNISFFISLLSLLFSGLFLILYSYKK